MLKIILTTVALCLTCTAQAAMVTHNGYTLNTETNIVTGGGFKWLQWDETTGLTLDQALASHPGMRLANNVETAALFNAFDFGGVFDSDANTGQGFSTPYDFTKEGIHEDFVELFGVTFPIGSYGLPDGTEGYNSAVAYFGGESGSEFFNRASVYGDAWNSSFPVNAFAYMGPLDPNNIVTIGYYPVGFALVSDVPIPAAAWLFGSALLGLVGMKRRKPNL